MASFGTATAVGAEPVATHHLTNPIVVHPRVISGGLPDSDAAFAELARLGVKTIISVDGAAPDVEAAAKYGLRYVHLPHGYDGISRRRTRELAKAVRELPGKIYIHCHHGKHRSPTAAAVACVSAGLIPAGEAPRVLTLAGTSPHYRGLFAAAQQAKPLATAELDGLQVEFRSEVPVPPLAAAMVSMERHHDRLIRFQANDWQSLETHPDLDPAHEALMLREQFTELMRTDDARRRSQEFLRMLKESEQACKRLESALRNDDNVAVRTMVRQALQQISVNCRRCHRRFRDNPEDEL